MEWTPEAEAALKKVPFFVRKKVRARTQKEAIGNGKNRVTVADLKATRARYLSGMESEIKGYQLNTCFGPSGCPNRAIASDQLLKKLQQLLKSAELLSFLKARVAGQIRFHHEFSVTLADCPNACSRPQICDIGIIGALVPELSEELCIQCGACADICKESAITLLEGEAPPQIDSELCLFCGQCIPVCESKTLVEGRGGYRVQLGGKLGRHPVLATELPCVFTEDEVLAVVETAIALYKERSTDGKRFGEILQAKDHLSFAKRFCVKSRA